MFESRRALRNNAFFLQSVRLSVAEGRDQTKMLAKIVVYMFKHNQELLESIMSPNVNGLFRPESLKKWSNPDFSYPIENTHFRIEPQDPTDLKQVEVAAEIEAKMKSPGFEKALQKIRRNAIEAICGLSSPFTFSDIKKILDDVSDTGGVKAIPESDIDTPIEVKANE